MKFLKELFKPKRQRLEEKGDVLGLLEYLCGYQGVQEPEEVYHSVKRMYSRPDVRDNIHPQLIKALEDERLEVLLMAMRLIFPQPDDWPAFAPLAQAPDARLRIPAARCLASCRSPQADEHLRGLLDDDYEIIQAIAAARLAQAGDGAMKEKLLDLLGSHAYDWEVREHALRGLRGFKDEKTRDGLIKALKSDQPTAIAALDLLGDIADDESIAAMIHALDSHVGHNSERLFGDDGGKAMMAVYMKGAYGNPEIQVKAARVLAKVAGDRGWFYAHCWQDKPEEARKIDGAATWAKEALGHPNDTLSKSAAKVLLELVDEAEITEFLLEQWRPAVKYIWAGYRDLANGRERHRAKKLGLEIGKDGRMMACQDSAPAGSTDDASRQLEEHFEYKGKERMQALTDAVARQWFESELAQTAGKADPASAPLPNGEWAREKKGWSEGGETELGLKHPERTARFKAYEKLLDQALADPSLDDPEEVARLCKDGQEYYPGASYRLNSVVKGLCLSFDARAFRPLATLYGQVEADDLRDKYRVCLTIAENIGMLKGDECLEFLKSCTPHHYSWQVQREGEEALERQLRYRKLGQV
jgi:hypothetical protein